MYLNLQNNGVPYTKQGDSRQLKIHTCFPQCRTNADCYLGFNIDDREKCLVGDNVSATQEEGIMCISDENVCETYVAENEMCMNDGNTLCISWSNIWIAIIILNSIQLLFEASMAYSLEISLQPTSLDRLEEDIEDGEDQSNSDKPNEL